MKNQIFMTAIEEIISFGIELLLRATYIIALLSCQLFRTNIRTGEAFPTECTSRGTLSIPLHLAVSIERTNSSIYRQRSPVIPLNSVSKIGNYSLNNRFGSRSRSSKVHAEMFNYRQRNLRPVLFPEKQTLSEPNPPDTNDVQFTAVTDNHYFFLHKLYLEESNPDPPSTLDPAISDPLTRLQICRDIGRSGVFERYGKTPLDVVNNIEVEFEQPKYKHLFGNLVENGNPFRLRYFPVYKFFPDQPEKEPVEVWKREYVFVCFLKDEEFGDIMPFYVSKAYEVQDGLRMHRFVFPAFPEREKYRFFYQYEKLMLAERSAEVYSRPNFDIENYYLQYYKPARECAFDPVCRLNLRRLEDNEHIRLCVVVLTSPYFKNKIQYPLRLHHDEWFARKISFKNVELRNLLEATGKNYYERMLRCSANMVDGDVKEFYISRAFNSNQVFVYTEDPSCSGAVYLETLCTNVGTVD